MTERIDHHGERIDGITEEITARKRVLEEIHRVHDRCAELLGG